MKNILTFLFILFVSSASIQAQSPVKNFLKDYFMALNKLGAPGLSDNERKVQASKLVKTYFTEESKVYNDLTPGSIENVSATVYINKLLKQYPDNFRFTYRAEESSVRWADKGLVSEVSLQIFTEVDLEMQDPKKRTMTLLITEFNPQKTLAKIQAINPQIAKKEAEYSYFTPPKEVSEDFKSKPKEGIREIPKEEPQKESFRKSPVLSRERGYSTSTSDFVPEGALPTRTILSQNLSNRKLILSPKLYSSTKQGKVEIRVCIADNGRVISAKLQSEEDSPAAIDIAQALENAKKWKFGRRDIDKQCGIITYSF